MEKYQILRNKYKPEIPYNEILSANEEKLDKYLSKIKKEADKFYSANNPYGIVEWNDKEDIHSELIDFCYKLPKGGDLHAHDNTMIPLEKFVEIMIDFAMISLNGDTNGMLYTIYSNDLPKDAIRVSEALDRGLINRDQLKDMLVIRDHEEENGPWKRLEKLFSATGDLYNDISIMEKIWEEGFRSCYEKGVFLVEIRDWAVEDDLLNIIRDRTIREAYYRVRRDHPDFLVRLIGCTGKDDTNSIESTYETIRSIIRVSALVKDEFDPDNPEDFIIGLDLANEEDNSKPLSEFALFLNSDEIRNCGLRLYLHCGESLRRDNDSVVDAFLLNSYRVGHGLNLYRFPELMKEYQKNDIAIEVCLMSNYRLGYVKDLRLHPGLQYMINNIPVVLCSDDGLFITRNPMVDDFYSAILCWDLGLKDIKAICRNSIKYSGLTEKEIQRLMRAFDEKWNNFVTEYLEKIDK